MSKFSVYSDDEDSSAAPVANPKKGGIMSFFKKTNEPKESVKKSKVLDDEEETETITSKKARLDKPASEISLKAEQMDDNVASQVEQVVSQGSKDTVTKTEATSPVKLNEAASSQSSTIQSVPTAAAPTQPKMNAFAMMMGKSKANSVAASNNSNSNSVSKASNAVANESNPTILENWARYGSGNLDSEGEEIGTYGSSNFDPIKHALWVKGAAVPYSAITLVFDKCEKTTKRLKIIKYLVDFYRSVIVLSPQHLSDCVHLCVNQVAPAYEGKELGIGEGTLIKALQEATGTSANHIKAKLVEIGDLGLIAEEVRTKQRTMLKPLPLTVNVVFQKFKTISELTGSGSNERRKDMIIELLVKSVGKEARFLARALQGQLRVHLALLTVLRALGEAVVLSPPEGVDNNAELEQVEGEDEEEEVDIDTEKHTSQEVRMKKAHALVEAAYNQGPSLKRVIDALLHYPLNQVRQRCGLMPGLPIKVMLGKPATSVDEVVTKFEGRKITLEYKYDGERAQIHRIGKEVKIYSRNLEDNTTKYPDIIKSLDDIVSPDTGDFILDAEVVAWDCVNEKILPFQTLSTRKRKDVKEEDVTIRVILFAFDMQYLNGVSYMESTYEERREKLHSAFIATPGKLAFATGLDTSDVNDIATFLQQAVTDSCEGLMVKPLDAPSGYVPDKRKWIKVKKDYLNGVGDTLDLVPLGAWYGKGKRTGVFGGFLLGCYDHDSEEYQTQSKIGTGFSEKDLEELSSKLKTHTIDAPPQYYKYHNSNVPDVWFEPAMVWEILCADLSQSPIYQAGIGKASEERGISTRFPRFMRVRDDKKPEEATSADQVVDMYFNQSVVKNNK